MLNLNRYNILAAEIMARAKNDKMAAKGLFDQVGLESEKYRLGHTKASHDRVALTSFTLWSP